MTFQNQYYDPNIYMQSKNLMLKVAHLYYYKAMRQQEISEQLEISVSTVSRLLKKAKEEKIVYFSIDEEYLECLNLEEFLREYCGLREVIVAPLPNRGEGLRPEEIKKIVGIEGARYLQRIVTDNDMVGVAYGETVWYVYNYLNPCQKCNVSFVTMHGALHHESGKLDGTWLVPRIAKVFGGNYYTINQKGIQNSREAVMRVLKEERVRTVFEQFPKITISISGVGMAFPETGTILLRGNYLSQQMQQQLEQAGACCDLVLRFLDKNGQECNTPLRSQAVGIPLESYRRIPNKIIVASDERKWVAVLALLRNRLVDTLIIDQNLARNVYKAMTEGAEE